MPSRSDESSIKLATLDDLNAAQMEILCELNFVKTDKDGIALKKYYANKLSEMYEHGVEGKVATDKWKARQYALIADEKAEIKTKETHVKTTTFYSLYRYYDRTRLFVLRLLHVVATQTSSMNVIAGPLSFASLASGLRLLVDFAMLFRPIVKPNTEEAKLSWRKRINNQWEKDNRRKRMYNDLIWFPINLFAVVLVPFTFGLSLLVPSILSAVFAISAFSWDVWNETSPNTGKKKYNDQDQLIKKLNAHIHTLQQAKTHIQNTIDEKNQSCAHLSSADLHLVKSEISQLQNQPAYKDANKEIQKYSIIQAKLLDSKKRERRKLIYNIVTTLMVCVGMAMFLFPPTSALGVVMLIGAVVSLTGGSIMNGLGMEVYDKFKALFKRHSQSNTAAVLPVDVDVVQEVIANNHSAEAHFNPVVTPEDFATPKKVKEEHSETYDPLIVSTSSVDPVSTEITVTGVSPRSSGRRLSSTRDLMGLFVTIPANTSRLAAPSTVTTICSPASKTPSPYLSPYTPISKFNLCGDNRYSRDSSAAQDNSADYNSIRTPSPSIFNKDNAEPSLSFTTDINTVEENQKNQVDGLHNAVSAF